MKFKTNYQKLLETGYIGKLPIRNRLIKTAALMSYTSGDDSALDERTIAFYEALAKGGVGLIIADSGYVDFPLGGTAPRSMHIDDDKYIPVFAELAKAVHKHNCPVFLSLLHAGPIHAVFTGLQPVSSSALAAGEMPQGPLFRQPPRELTVAEIEKMIEQFVNAAERAGKAGFDGVEFNSGSYHMLNTFLSSFWNRRTDEYGCASLENRSRVIRTIIAKTKERLGNDFPLGVLINGAEFGIPNGTKPEDGREFARLIEKAGADAIQIRAYGYGDYFHGHLPDSFFYPEPPSPLAEPLDGSHHDGEGALVPMAAAVKQLVSIPVITVGRISPVLGEEILQQGKADFIGVTRPLFADPDLPNKIAARRFDDIAPCIACVECYRTSRHASGVGALCKVNAAIGSKDGYEIKPADKKKKIVVIGGGPAGMEAAMVAALRGHEVILYEKGPALGGLLPLAIVVKGADVEDNAALIDYLKRQIRKYGVDVRLQQEFKTAFLDEIKPDVVILATGGIPALPEVPGINGNNVVKAGSLYKSLRFYLRFFKPETIRRLTAFWMPVGKKVVIMDGTIHGCQLAEFLAMRGRKVTIVSRDSAIGEGLVEVRKYYLLRWLAKKGVTMIIGAKFDEISDKGLKITTKEGEKRTIEADSIVPTMLFQPDPELLQSLKSKVPEIYDIGDCRDPKLTLEAIADGWRVARAI